MASSPRTRIAQAVPGRPGMPAPARAAIRVAPRQPLQRQMGQSEPRDGWAACAHVEDVPAWASAAPPREDRAG